MFLENFKFIVLAWVIMFFAFEYWPNYKLHDSRTHKNHSFYFVLANYSSRVCSLGIGVVVGVGILFMMLDVFPIEVCYFSYECTVWGEGSQPPPIRIHRFLLGPLDQRCDEIVEDAVLSVRIVPIGNGVNDEALLFDEGVDVIVDGALSKEVPR